MPSSALPVGCTRSLDPFRPAADSAETVEEKIYDLALSRNGGICCYSTQSGSAHLPLSPVSEEGPAIRVDCASEKEPFCAIGAAGFHSKFLVFGPRTGLFPEILSSG